MRAARFGRGSESVCPGTQRRGFKWSAAARSCRLDGRGAANGSVAGRRPKVVCPCLNTFGADRAGRLGCTPIVWLPVGGAFEPGRQRQRAVRAVANGRLRNRDVQS